MKKIDIHMHCFRHKPLCHTGDDGTFMLPEEVLAVYRELNIDGGILLPVVSPEYMNSVQGNEEVCEICAAYPDVFRWFCNIDPRNHCNSPESDLSAALLAYKARGALGVGEITANLPFDDPLVENLFGHCQRCEMPVLFHIGPKKGGCYGLIDQLGLPALEKQLEKFPRLIFIGHSQPFWAEISASVSEEDRNAYPKGPVVPGRVVDLMRKYDNLYGDLSANSGFNAVKRDEAFGCAFIEEFQDRLFFGTDICAADERIGLSFWLDDMLAQGKISKVAYEKVSRGNAERLLLGRP